MSLVDSEFRVSVRLPETLAERYPERHITIENPMATLGELVSELERRIPEFDRSEEEIYNFAVNGNLILHGESSTPIANGDQIELMIVFAGG